MKKLKLPCFTSDDEEIIQLAIKKTNSFHGRKAPGVTIGCYMVYLAKALLQKTKNKLNAIVETKVCLTDAIQIMTGLTVGNKYLHIKDYGRYAMCLYDRETGLGIRVSINYEGIDKEKFPYLKAFFDGTRTYETISRPKQQQLVLDEFLRVKWLILNAYTVKVNMPAKQTLYKLKRCSKCLEYFKPTPKEPRCLCEAELGLYLENEQT